MHLGGKHPDILSKHWHTDESLRITVKYEPIKYAVVGEWTVEF